MDTAYSRLLNGCQTKAASGSGLGDGGKQNDIGCTQDCVLLCTPMITETEPVTESPNVGKEHMVVDIIQPSGFSCDTNLETLWLS